MEKKGVSVITAILMIMVFVFTGCGSTEKAKMAEGTVQTISGVEKAETSKKEAAAKPGQTAASQAESTKEMKEAAADKEAKGTEASQVASKETKEQKASEASNEAEKASGSSKNAKDTQDTQTASKPAGSTSSTASKQPSGETAKPSGDSAGSSKEESKTPEPAHTCTWDGGSITREPDCSNAGEKTYTCTVCGKTRTESIGKTDHSYVTETTAPTCTEAGHTKTYCSICGAVQSDTESGSPAGHSFVKEYWPSEPTCQHGGSYNLICANCGENGGHGSDPALPHTPVTREETTPAVYCDENGVLVTECSVCGFELDRQGYSGTEHEWVETEDQVFNEETLEWETVYYSYCRRCHAQQH